MLGALPAWLDWPVLARAHPGETAIATSALQVRPPLAIINLGRESIKPWGNPALQSSLLRRARGMGQHQGPNVVVSNSKGRGLVRVS